MANLHPVPDGVSTENAAFAEPLAAAFRIVEQQLVPPGGSVAVVGDGSRGSRGSFVAVVIVVAIS